MIMRNKIIFLSVITINILLASCERAYNIEEYMKSKEKIISINKEDWLYSEDGAYYYMPIASSPSETVGIIYVKLPGDNEYKIATLEFSENINNIHVRFQLEYSDEYINEHQSATIRVYQIDNNSKYRPPSMKFKIIYFIDNY